MLRYIASRIGQIIVTLLLFFALTYFLLDAQPGDITLQYLNNPRFSPAQREALQRRLGLDRPAGERFIRWLGNILQGDLGDSYQHNRPVIDVIAERAPRTILLFLTSTLLQFGLGYNAGKMPAWRRGTGLEIGTTVVGSALYTAFTPWVGLMMIFLFGFTLDWVPINKFIDVSLWRRAPDELNLSVNAVVQNMLLTFTLFVVAVGLVFYLTRRMNAYRAQWIRLVSTLAFVVIAVGVWASSPYGIYAGDILYHMVLPIALLVLVNFAGTMLLTRTTMLETLREDYIMAARAKGLSEKAVRDKHAARNALLPVLTSLIISLPFILAGGIITETIFSWEGMGLALLDASNNNDIPMVMGAFLFIGTLALFAHLVADILYAFLDPRIRYG